MDNINHQFEDDGKNIQLSNNKNTQQIKLPQKIVTFLTMKVIKF